MRESANEIKRSIRHIFADELKNNKRYQKLFDSIIVGSQNAQHAIYTQLKKAYPFHLMPSDFSEETPQFRVKSVISYAIVFKYWKIEKARSFSPKPWVEATYFFRRLSDTINERILKKISSITIIIPKNTRRYTRYDTKEAFYASWSERHIAYTCGLGTFGLHHGLITEKGCQVRLSSLLSSAINDTPPTSLKGIYDHCLFYKKGTCKKCMERCPVSAINGEKKDMIQCYKKEDTINKAFNAKHYHLNIPTCGLCMMDVPCARRIPVKSERES